MSATVDRVAPVESREIDEASAKGIVALQEGHFLDFKAADSTGKTLQKVFSAMANADGGEVYIGIADARTATNPIARWSGFAVIEDATPVLHAVARDLTPPAPYEAEWLTCPILNGSVVCHITVFKSAEVHETADGSVYVRRGAESTKISAGERVQLALSKGARSYEDQLLKTYLEDDLAEEPELAGFLDHLNPHAAPREFIRREHLVDRKTGEARFAGAILFASNPSAVAPKRCAIKIARYATRDAAPERKHLQGTPVTIEGPARVQIEESIAAVQALVEDVSVLSTSGELIPIHYPPDALKEIIVNAVIHRDYNLSDDILISVFDNRVVVRSPGRLPGHMTLDNLLTERFSRNPNVTRLINKYPDPPNQDIGEGLKTVYRSMQLAKLKAPKFELDGNYFTVTLEHTPLARPEEIILEYLQSHDEISNAIARGLTGINSENSMKSVFYGLAKAGRLERVPGRRGNKAAWREIKAPEAGSGSPTPEVFEPTVAEPPGSSTSSATPHAPGPVDQLKRRVQRPQPRRLTRAARR